jgi:hypothetical protein
MKISDKGTLATLRSDTAWREVEIGRGSPEASFPMTAWTCLTTHSAFAFP